MPQPPQPLPVPRFVISTDSAFLSASLPPLLLFHDPKPSTVILWLDGWTNE